MSTLPIDIWILIVEHLIINDRKDVFALLLTCKALHSEAQHVLDRHLHVNKSPFARKLIKNLPTHPRANRIHSLHLLHLFPSVTDSITLNAALRALENLKLFKIYNMLQCREFNILSLMNGVSFRLHTLWCEYWTIIGLSFDLLQSPFGSQIQDLTLEGFDPMIFVHESSALPRLCSLQLTTLSRPAFQLAVDRRVTRLAYKTWDTDNRDGVYTSDWIQTLSISLTFQPQNRIELINLRYLYLYSNLQNVVDGLPNYPLLKYLVIQISSTKAIQEGQDLEAA